MPLFDYGQIKQGISDKQNFTPDPNNMFSTRPLGEGFGLGDYYRQIQMNVAQGLLDPQSAFYQQFRSFLGGVTPNPGANSFLSALQAGGGNMGASQVQAQQQQRGAEGRRNDFLNTTTKGFASQNIGLGVQAIGQAQGSDLQQQGIATRNKQVQQNEPGWFDILTSPLAFASKFLLPGGQGGGGGASQAQSRY